MLWLWLLRSARWPRGGLEVYSVSPSQPPLPLVKTWLATELLRPLLRAMAFTVVVAVSVMGAL